MRFLLVILCAIFIAHANDFERVYELKEQYERLKANLQKEASVRAFGSHLEYLKQKNLASSAKTKAAAQARLNILKDYEHFNLLDFYNPPALEEAISVSNVYEILNGLSEQRLLRKNILEYAQINKRANELIINIEKLVTVASKLAQISELDASYLKELKTMLEAHKQGLLAISNGYELYESKANTLIKQLDVQINQQYRSAAVFAAVILAIVAVRILLARIIRAAVENKDKLYSITKILNIFTTFIIILFSIFYFVENISYLISVLGFASAGLAIAMKDMFMSLLGWCVLQFGGGFHVGDRVRVSKDGSVFVGDIVDISLLKMTIYEDVTLTTYTQNRRAGRLVYIPNNYIFTDLLANYNYAALKSVWDGIDITFSFDSDIDYAREIMLNTATELSAPLATAAKSAISKMRNHYSMRSSGTEAKIFTFIEPYGVRLSVWFMAPSRETLKMRSIISAAILEKIRTAKSRIKIAYPTQTIYKKEIE